jgi:hypothetical protein
VYGRAGKTETMLAIHVYRPLMLVAKDALQRESQI